MKTKQANVYWNSKRIIAVVLLAVLICCLVTPSAADAASSDESLRMNVMLVIDGSGSLLTTDRSNLRYDAIDLFLAMLTNAGNNVGAIVFDHATDPFLMYSPIAPMEGKAEKMALSEKIRSAGVRGDTNIGAALLAAVQEAQQVSQNNGMKSVVILFSDGRTDLAGNANMTRDEAMNASFAAKDQGIELAQQAGIPVYSICLNASATASPDELQEISDRTGGNFVSVSHPKDLTTAFETFYHLIFSTCTNEIQQASFPEDGKLTFSIDIPSYGAEEVNIILDTTSMKEKNILSPNGALTEAQVNEFTMQGGFYDVIKLVNPDSGSWEVSLTGIPQEAVTINVLYNMNSTVSLATANGITDYGVGEDAVFTATLLENGVPVTDPKVSSEYSATLTLVKNATGEVLPPVQMMPTSNGQFTYNMRGMEYASYTAQVDMQFANLVISSNTLNINFGNTPPAAIKAREEIKKTVTPISGKNHTVKLSDFFYDAQDKDLTYTVLSSQLVKDTWNLDPATGVLTVNTGKSKSGEVLVQATDSQGATAQMVIYFKVTNLTFVISGTLIGGILAGLAVLLVSVYAATHKVWHGTLTVHAIGGMGQSASHGDFRGKIKLKNLPLGDVGVDGAFVAMGGNKLQFRATKNVYPNNGVASNTKVVPLIHGSVKIYADEARTIGIQVDVKPRVVGGFGGRGPGGLGGMGGGRTSSGSSGNTGLGGLGGLSGGKAPGGSSGFGGMGGGKAPGSSSGFGGLGGGKAPGGSSGFGSGPFKK